MFNKFCEYFFKALLDFIFYPLMLDQIISFLPEPVKVACRNLNLLTQTLIIQVCK